MDGNQFTQYRYETHLHTKEASACAKMSGAEYAQLYKDLGYAGFFVTDHFYHGNTAIDRNLPWNEFINGFCRGFECAKEAGDRVGIDVFFGWEENFEGDEYLIYGLDKEWMLCHPEMLHWTQKEQHEAVRQDGGLVVQAHPFRDRDYIRSVNLHPYQADAWEVNNYGNVEEMDAFAYCYAKEHHLRMTSGSDVHFLESVMAQKGGMIFESPLRSAKDYVDRILAGEGEPMLFPERMVMKPERGHRKKVYLFDKENNKSEYTDEFTRNE